MEHTKKSRVYDNKGRVRLFVIIRFTSYYSVVSYLFSSSYVDVSALSSSSLSFFALFLTIAMFKYHARRNYYVLNSQNIFTGNEIGNHYPKSRKTIPEKKKKFLQAWNVFDPHGILIKILQLCLKKGFKGRMKGLVTSFPEWFVHL